MWDLTKQLSHKKNNMYLLLPLVAFLYFYFSCKFLWHADGVQDTLPQNMSPCPIEYFKLKEFEKWQAQEGLSDLPMKQVIKPPCERYSPYTQKKEHSCLWRWRDKERNLNKQALLSFPSLLHAAHLSPITFSHTCPPYIKPSIKHSNVTVSSGLHFLRKSPMPHKTYIK